MAYPDLQGLPHLYSGKVRETYAVGEDKLLILASDRISAFDCHVGDIPRKGERLTAMSSFWFKKLQDVIPNHLTDIAPEDVVAADDAIHVVGRSMVVKRLRPIAYEAVVRGYITGSGWKDYQETGAVCGIALRPGLKLSQKLDEPIFTPATKEPIGKHDQNVPFAHVAADIGSNLAERMRTASIELYRQAAEHALSYGIIIADTKFEFGLDEAGNLVWMDEALTPDSSRFWPVDGYDAAFAAGANPPSFDKQYVRDYLEAVRINGKPWNKEPPAPPLPRTVIQETAEKYQRAFYALCR